MTEIILQVVNKHVPFEKVARGKQALFVNKDVRKAIYTKNTLRNSYFEKPNVEKWTSLQKSTLTCFKKVLTMVLSQIKFSANLTNPF